MMSVHNSCSAPPIDSGTFRLCHSRMDYLPQVQRSLNDLAKAEVFVHPNTNGLGFAGVPRSGLIATSEELPPRGARA